MPDGARNVRVIPEQEVGGHRLGRHIEHDERSRAFGITRRATPIASRHWTRHVPIYDQGNLGSCTGNAMAGALSTGPWSHRFTETTAVRIYKAATVIDGIPGTYPPDDTGSSGLAVAKVAQTRGWITSYRHCFSLDDVLAVLQTGPVIAGTNWHEGMDTPGPAGIVHPTGAVRGGHEYCLVGCNVASKTIRAANSWSETWGDKGYFTIGWDDFAALLAEDGDVTVPVA